MDNVLKNIIAYLGSERGAKKGLLDYLELPSSTFGDWQAGRNKSYMKHLPQIADYFGVSAEYESGSTPFAGSYHDIDRAWLCYGVRDDSLVLAPKLGAKSRGCSVL